VTCSYDAWQYSEPTAWRERSLHWHAYSWRGDGKRLGDNAARRATTSDVVPFALRDWLMKSARLIRAAPATPEEALRWLRQQFDDCASSMCPAQQRTSLSDEFRFGLALYELRCANDLSWGFWLTNASFQAMSLIAVADSPACACRAL
jgi:hypothetical protein